MEKEELRKAVGIVLVAAAALVTMPRARAASDAEAIAIQRATPVDRTGRARVGIASYYHRMFNGRKMADGQPFDPNGINAASKSLPLGTVALVTNLENNRTAIVRIQDRGPYSGDRIVDLSPRVAEELGMTHQGLAKVEVAPLAVPLPDGSMRAGVAARSNNLRVAAGS